MRVLPTSKASPDSLNGMIADPNSRSKRIKDSCITDQQINTVFATAYKVAYKITQRKEISEDLAMETMLNVYKNFQKFDRRKELEPWVIRIAYNITCSYLRKRNRENCFTAMEDLKDTESFLPLNHRVKPGRGDPSVICEQRWDAQNLHSRLDGINKEQLQALELSLDGYSYDEIAHQQGVASGTVRSRINRAKRAARAVLSQEPDL